MSSSTEQSVDWALQMLVVAGAAAFAHALFLAGNWGVVKAWSLAGHDNADSYIMEGSAFDEKAHVAQANAVERSVTIVASQKALPTTLAMLGLLITSGGAGWGGTALYLLTGGASAGGGCSAVLAAATAAAVAAHLAQSFLDFAVGAAWLARDPTARKTAEQTAKGLAKMGLGGGRDCGLTAA